MQLSAETSNKIKNIGIVCALLVPFIHVGRPLRVGSGGWWLYQFTAEGISRIAVPFFFACSGFFLARHFDENKWYREMVQKRVKSLVIPYLLWSFIYFCFTYIIFLISHNSPQAWQIAKPMSVWERILQALGLNFSILPMLYPLWYVRALFFLVLASPLFALCVKTSKISLIIITLVPYILFNPGDVSPIGMHIPLPFEGVFYFSLGVCMGYGPPLYSPKGINGIFLVLVAISLVFARALAIRLSLRDYVLMCLFKPFFIFLGLYGTWLAFPKMVWPENFTHLAFPVYVLHVFALQLFRCIWGRDSDNLLVLVFKAAFGICISLIVAHLMRNVIGKRLACLWGWR